MEAFTSTGTILISYIDRKILLVKHPEGHCIVLYESDVNNCWSSINLVPFLVYKHKNLLLKCKPNGCRIDQRSIDLYLKIMQEFGFKIKNLKDGSIKIKLGKCENNKTIELPFPSFTGSSIAIYCSMINTKKTIIKNVSLKPEILYLIKIVKKLGWKIEFYNNTLYIENTGKEMSILNIRIPEDRNVLVTKIIYNLINNKRFYYSSENNLYLMPLIEYFDKIGVKYNFKHSFDVC